MKVRDLKSIIIILVYICLNAFVVITSVRMKPGPILTGDVDKASAPEFTEIENLDYFHLKSGIPQMSLSALQMRSHGDELAEFVTPRGVYNSQEQNRTIKYSAQEALYRKKKDLLNLDGAVVLTTDEAIYNADKIKFFIKKDLIIGTGNVKFEGDDLKSKDHLVIHADSMKAKPHAQKSKFSGGVTGSMERKKKYEGKMTFSSHELLFDGAASLAQLLGDVQMKRDTYEMSSGKADIHLENFNKSLKYFVLNDDVKLTEKLATPQGISERKAFSERLEGFGREQKMVLSGAPRVEMGKDVIKGYRITIRENVDLIEVEDAMSDVQVKRKELKE